MKYTNPHGNIVPMQSLVFPFAIKTESSIEILGTGFFIQSGGGFITAKHLLFDNEGNPMDASIMAIDYRSPQEGYFRKINHFFFFEEKRDICLGMLDGPIGESSKNLINEKLTIRSRKLEVNEKVVSLGYPLNKVVEDDNGEITGMFRMEKHEGVITQHFPEGRDKSALPYECYETSLNIESGASGGPVFDSNGQIVGINSRGMSWDQDSISWITPITEILDIPIPYIDNKSMRELSDTPIFNIT